MTHIILGHLCHFSLGQVGHVSSKNIKFVIFSNIAVIYRIRGNFLGSYVSQITHQKDFCVLIFADDLPLNDYTALEYCLLIEVFED